MSTRLHDLKTVHMDFKIILNLVKTGYKFDDEDAPAVIRQLEKSLGVLETEIERIRVSDKEDK